MRTEPTAAEVGFLLAEIDASTRRVAASLGAVDEEGLSAPSLLPGWARATIAAHLTWVADRYVVMTGDALAGMATTTYPGGPAQRDAVRQPFRLPPRQATRPTACRLWRPTPSRRLQARLPRPLTAAPTAASRVSAPPASPTCSKARSPCGGTRPSRCLRRRRSRGTPRSAGRCRTGTWWSNCSTSTSTTTSWPMKSSPPRPRSAASNR